MKKVLVIAGPTAVGKSNFAIEVAKRLDGIVISGDSIQVYRGFDIGSGKIKEEEKQGIPHYLLDVKDAHMPYSVADFQKMAREVIQETTKLPIICGGTGLYLKACLYDYDFKEEAGERVDVELERYSSDELWAMLRVLDERQAQKVHPHNRRRLLRSLTVIRSTGRKQSEIHDEQTHEPVFDMFIAGCTMERSLLYARIDRRVDGMFEDGLEGEVRGLLEKGITFTDQPMQGIGYKEWKPYFEGTASIEEVKDSIKKHSHQFAKRQYTWLNHQMPVHWFDVQDTNEREKMTEEIVRWYHDECQETEKACGCV